MKRNIDINEVSDGKLYEASDMARLGCNDCAGCHDCCTGMGKSIVLDPMDIWRIEKDCNIGFEELVDKYIEFNVVDGLILPNLRQENDKEECAFLNGEGRCSIHKARPGICRLFPLGRIYDKEGFKYFLQVYECSKADRSKVKIKKWIGIDDISSYEKYILEWHRFLKMCEEAMTGLSEENHKILTMYVLKTFYQTPFAATEENTFYSEFYSRLNKARELF